MPEALEIDSYDGRAFVGLVPFTMHGVRLALCPPVPGFSRFHEINVRTYVRHRGADPGIFFFSLDAANRTAVLTARALWRLPYHFAAMDLACEDGTVRYRSTRRWPGPLPAACRLLYGPRGAAAPASPGTLEHFLVERYALYTTARGKLLRGRVQHAPYPCRPDTAPSSRRACSRPPASRGPTMPRSCTTRRASTCASSPSSASPRGRWAKTGDRP